jgi:hypothetical protein
MTWKKLLDTNCVDAHATSKQELGVLSASLQNFWPRARRNGEAAGESGFDRLMRFPSDVLPAE